MLIEPLVTPEAEQTGVRPHSRRKRHGIHYTPAELARFVARRALREVGPSLDAVLDPACGDGELLLAIATEAAQLGLAVPLLVGVDRDEEAVLTARKRLDDAPCDRVTVYRGDFLSMRSEASDGIPDLFSLIISNPPYVRTQVLGAAQAQALARQFGLTGRVDLHHAFVAAMTTRLIDHGVLGLLCSNRFLTTKGGGSLRSLLLRHYDIAELWDLGDTKLFEAAVLPAVVVARRGSTESSPARFVRVYEETDAASPKMASSLLDTLEGETEGLVQVGGRCYAIERGKLSQPTASRPWRLTSLSGSRWLAAVKKHAIARFGDFGPIRVGIKTTADSVFIKQTWTDLDAAFRPEESLIRPLLTHRVAARWVAEENPEATRSVLYTHEMHRGRRRAIELTRYPRAAAYLEQHRAQLEGRAYVMKAGRGWYEIWVPQQPDAWLSPKLVWPDISGQPRFFLDLSGALVNGDCYWLSLDGDDEPMVALALAVANSTFAVQYYDLCCGNRLYAGRRRFITQYLEELPIPDASSAALRNLSEMVEQLRQRPHSSDAAAVEAALDSAVFELFGLKEVAR